MDITTKKLGYNSYLMFQLKDIMTVALQAEGENVSKLEKADILELTVRHLHPQAVPGPETVPA